MKWVSKVAPFILLCTVLCTPASAEPAYNCAFAKLPAEILLCQDESLGAKDRDMSALYYAMYNAASSRVARQLANEQRAWLKRRNACNYDAACMSSLYYDRMTQLCERIDYSNAVCGAMEENEKKTEQVATPAKQTGVTPGTLGVDQPRRSEGDRQR